MPHKRTLYESLCGDRQCKPNQDIALWFETPTSRLDLSRHYLGSALGFLCVIEALNGAHLQEIDLSHCLLDGDCMSTFLRMAEEFTDLHCLRLSNNGLNSEHGRLLLRLVRINRNITHVELGDVEWTSERSNDIPRSILASLERQLQENSMVMSTMM